MDFINLCLPDNPEQLLLPTGICGLGLVGYEEREAKRKDFMVWIGLAR